MDLEKLATMFGLPGLLIGIWYLLERSRIAANAKIEDAKVAAENRRTDAMSVGFQSLSGKIDSHHTSDLQSHGEMATGIAELHGKIDQALADRTPVDGRRVTPPHGVGYYPPGRPKTQGGR